MTGRQRAAVAGMVFGALLVGVVLVAFASQACPREGVGQPCPDAARNVVLVVTLAALGVGLLVTPFAFLAEFLVRRRIIYRGAWWRAARRGALSALTVAVLAGLRLGGALTVAVTIFVVVLALIAERFLRTLER